MLSEFASSLPFDEISALDSALYEYGNNDDAAYDAIHSALNYFIGNLEESLSEIDSVDELESFEKDLSRLMDRRGYTNPSVHHQIQSRLEYLYDREEHDREGYSSRQTISDSSVMTTDQIRSMFRGMREGDHS